MFETQVADMLLQGLVQTGKTDVNQVMGSGNASALFQSVSLKQIKGTKHHYRLEWRALRYLLDKGAVCTDTYFKYGTMNSLVTLLMQKVQKYSRVEGLCDCVFALIHLRFTQVVLRQKQDEFRWLEL